MGKNKGLATGGIVPGQIPMPRLDFHEDFMPLTVWNKMISTKEMGQAMKIVIKGIKP